MTTSSTGQTGQGRFLRNVLLKGLALFLIVNFLFAAWNPAQALGKASAYNVLFPGRQRFPFGETPQEAYNFSLFNLEAMFASHEIHAGEKPGDEFRVIVIGDSSVWGTLLKPGETLSGALNAMHLTAADGRSMRFYNLGYPTLSLTKDLMILQEATRYRPDLILWPMTLEAFPRDKQLTSPLVAHQTQRVQDLIRVYSLQLDPQDPALEQPNFWQQTLIGQRRDLADLARLQLYGAMWAATGVDQVYPQKYPAPQTDFEADASFHGQEQHTFAADELAFDVLAAGVQAAGNTPVLLVNEPMLVSSGKNSDLRYNFFYPRWAYDQYRQQWKQTCQEKGWSCLDLWNQIESAEFTNSAIHLTPDGEKQMAELLRPELLKAAAGR